MRRRDVCVRVKTHGLASSTLPLGVYQEFFEKPFLDASVSFYRAEVRRAGGRAGAAS